MPERVRRVASSFSLVGTSGANCGPAVLSSRDGIISSPFYADMVHVVCAAAAVEVSFYAGGVQTVVQTINHATPLALDGTVYSWAVRFEGTTVVIEMPDGTEQSVTNAGLDKAGRWLTIESYVHTAQDAEPRWESVRASS